MITIETNHRIVFLRFVKNYLLTDPKEDFVTSEVKQLENRLEKLNKNYSEIPNKPKDESLFLKEYQKENNYSHINEQLKVLKFILQ